MPAPAEIQAKTLDKFIEAWRGWTTDGFLATWADDCTQKTLLFGSDVPFRTRADTETLFPVLMGLMSNFQLIVHNVVHDAVQGKTVIYAITKADTPFRPYNNEHALFLWFNESGRKVSIIEEMLEAIVIKDFLPELGAYVAQQKAQAAA